MSSTICTVQLQSIPLKPVVNLKLEGRQHKLVRTYSIEKIKRFNTFICSQQYYVLPAILGWLRSSQSGLQASTEKTIFFFRSLFFCSFIYKLFLLGFKSKETLSVRVLIENVEKQTAWLIANFYKTFSKCFESTFLLATGVYLACTLVLMQLFVSLYLIYFSLVPHGFTFLCGCMMTMKYLCFRTWFHAMTRRSSPKRDIKIKRN